MANMIDFHEPIFRKEKNGTYSVNANLVKLFRTHGYEIITADMYQMLIDSHVKLTAENGYNSNFVEVNKKVEKEE